jgi:predicted transcriptional regulator
MVQVKQHKKTINGKTINVKEYKRKECPLNASEYLKKNNRGCDNSKKVKFSFSKDMWGQPLTKNQKDEIFNLVSVHRMGLLENPSNAKSFAERMDTAFIPYSTQNKAIHLSEKNPNDYINQIVTKVIKD